MTSRFLDARRAVSAQVHITGTARLWFRLDRRLVIACHGRERTRHVGHEFGSGCSPWDAEVMPLSARNQLEGKVLEVTLGDIMAHVVVRIGKNQIESVITRRS